MTKSDDAALFELWLTRKDGDAFAELARRHAPVVYDLAARAMGDRTAAEDVVQEALLDLALEPTRKPAEVGVVAWLARFAICRARNQRSSERCRARRQQIVGLRRPEESMPDEHLEQTEELEHALAAAEPDERAVLAMRFLHGWEYDRIAQALETTEGAARVRVHRALSNVRGRLGAGRDDAHVARGMAAIALIPLPAAKLDGVIRAALDAAGVPPVGMGASRLPGALRAGLQSFGVAVLLVGAAASSTESIQRAEGESARETEQALVAFATAGARPSARGAAGAAFASSAFAVPRPEDWDGGALGRLARGETGFDSDSPREVPAPAPAPAPREEAAALPPAAAPAAQPDQPPSAFRPSERGASAANCDPGSSDDERADALGGFFRGPTAEPVAERAPQEPAAETPSASDDARTGPAPRRRVVVHGRTFEALDAAEQAVVEEAAALVRDVVAKAAPEVSLADDRAVVRQAKKRTAQVVKRHVRELRRQAPEGAPRLSPRKAAKLRRLIAVLVDYAFAEGAATGSLRWPDGVDVSAALQDLIRVLTSAPAAPSPTLPDAAGDAPAAEADASALPDGR